MKKQKILIIGLILICTAAFGQEQNSVVVFKGLKAPYKQQKVMDFSYQNLSEVPYEANNPEIEVLILDNNKIEKLPNWISNLKKLRVLSIRNNNLLKLNTAISFCENLEQLYLSGNKSLDDLPSLPACEKIEIIDVIDTGINEIPGWVEMMNSLFYFKYTKNKN
ncbi:MAG: leucine-rich repeat domain-containing protein [Bacteroidales bacterium]